MFSRKAGAGTPTTMLTSTSMPATSSLSLTTLWSVCSIPDAYPDMRYVQRGNRLWDRFENKFDFGSTDFNKLCINEMVMQLDWDLVPHSAQQYMVIRAARIHCRPLC